LILSSIPGSFHQAAILDLEHLGNLTADRQEQNGRYFVLADEGGDYRGWQLEPAKEGVQCATVVLPIDRDFLLRLAVAERFYRRLSGEGLIALPRNLQLTRNVARGSRSLCIYSMDMRQAPVRARLLPPFSIRWQRLFPVLNGKALPYGKRLSG